MSGERGGDRRHAEDELEALKAPGVTGASGTVESTGVALDGTPPWWRFLEPLWAFWTALAIVVVVVLLVWRW